MSKFSGTGVALVTPFDERGQIDFDALGKVLVHTATGVDYYVVLGTTGESVTTSPEEKAAILKFVKEHNPRSLPIVYGIGGNNTAHVLEEIRHTDLMGVDAILSVSPYYNKPSQEGIVRHFTGIAEESPVPVILYNVPGRTSSNLTASTTLKLASHENIAGIKEASGMIDQCLLIARDKPTDFDLISGDDMLTLPILSIGGSGVISVLANAYPLVFNRMIAAFRGGNHEAAAREAQQLVGINSLMYEEGSPVGVKALLRELGVCGNHVRLPMVEASPGLRERIIAAAKLVKP